MCLLTFILEQWITLSHRPVCFRSKRLEGIEERLSQILSRIEVQQSVTTAIPVAKASEPAKERTDVDPPGETVGLLELQRVLMTLQHMEDKEEQIRYDDIHSPRHV